jgi:hypothetical protein
MSKARFVVERRHASGNAYRVRDTLYGQIVNPRQTYSDREAKQLASRLNTIHRTDERRLP